MSKAPKRIRVWPDYNYHTTPVSADWTVGWWDTTDNPKGTEYIRADLVEAAIKRALEGAANMIRDGMDDSEWYNPVRAIRALDPAQFIEEPKE